VAARRVLVGAVVAGDIDKAHVRRLAGARNPRTVEAFARDEAALVRLAQEERFFQFSIAVNQWLLENDPDGTSKEDLDRRDRRDVWLAESFEGMHLPYVGDAQLHAVLFDANGLAIEASRRRFFTGVLRRIIEVRDGFCACGCDTPAERCQIDHKKPWVDGGMTCQCNGGALCKPSNRRKGRRRSPFP
jgi:hypothetical protein